MPMARRRCTKTGPYEVSRSRIRYQGRVIPRERLGDLARDPFGGRIRGHSKRDPKPSAMPYGDKTIEGLERDRRQDKEIDRRDLAGMIPEKRSPALGRWPPAAAHISSDRRLGDVETELEQLTMNAWGAPQRIRAAHLANERTQLGRNLRSANRVARSPAPIRPKPSAVPTNDRLRSNNRDRAKHRGEQPIKPNEQKSIHSAQVWMFRHAPAKHIDLLPENQDLGIEICSRFEKRGKQSENQLEQVDH